MGKKLISLSKFNFTETKILIFLKTDLKVSLCGEGKLSLLSTMGYYTI